MSVEARFLEEIASRLEPDPVELMLTRIEQASKTARVIWIGLLAFFAFASVTLLGVEDTDFFIPSHKTALPLISVDVPTASFFWIFVLLGLLLYIYLHLHLYKLWTALADAEARPRGKALGGQTYPWLLIDVALDLRQDEATMKRPMRIFSRWTNLILVWGAGPVVFISFWWRSMAAHEEWMTLFIALCVWLSVVTAASSWGGYQRVLLQTQATSSRLRKAILASASIAFLVVLALFSWVRTEGGTDQYLTGRFHDSLTFSLDDVVLYPKPESGGRFTLPENKRYARQGRIRQLLSDSYPFLARLWNLAPTDLRGVEFVPKPPDWRTPAVAEREFLSTWCTRNGIDRQGCEFVRLRLNVSMNEILGTQKDLCERSGGRKECTGQYDSILDSFRADWSDERASYRSSLPRLDLRGRDLRGANLEGAFLADVSLQEVRLGGADLDGAVLEGANLRDARLRGASLFAANLQWTNLWGVDLEDATLVGAKLSNAQLRAAKFVGADLLRADLRYADLMSANFDGANLTAANLSEANTFGASWRMAKIEGVLLAGASIDVADNLTQRQLDTAVGNAATELPKEAAEDTGKPFRIPGCLVDLPNEYWLVFNSREPGAFTLHKPGAPQSWKCTAGVRHWYNSTGDTTEGLRFRDIMEIINDIHIPEDLVNASP